MTAGQTLDGHRHPGGPRDRTGRRCAMNIDGQTSRGAAAVRSIGTIELGGGRDRPLSFHWKPLNPEILERLGLPTPLNALHAQTRASILTEAYITGRGEPQ